MSTHRNEAQGFYMKSTEFASVRGVPAVVVSMRAACLLTDAKHDFIWYLQGLSLREGGLQRVARELLEMFPARLGTDKMHEAKIDPEKSYPRSILGRMAWYDFNMSDSPTRSGKALLDHCRNVALRGAQTPPVLFPLDDGRSVASRGSGTRSNPVPSIDQFIIDPSPIQKRSFPWLAWMRPAMN